MDHSPEFLQSLCDYWQKRLRLLDWKLTIRYSKPNEIADCRGYVNSFPNLKSAEIIILDQTSELAKQFLFTTFEKLQHTLVHELLHLHFAPFKNQSVSPLHNTMEEQIVECLAQALTLEIHNDNPFRQLEVSEKSRGVISRSGVHRSTVQHRKDAIANAGKDGRVLKRR